MDNSDTPVGSLVRRAEPANCIPLYAGALFCPTGGAILPRCLSSSARSSFMVSAGITWAMQQNNGDVLVVCGGLARSPALAKCGAMPAGNEQARIVPAGRWRYRLLSHTPTVKSALMCWQDNVGMPAPVWQTGAGSGLQQAGESTAENVFYPFAPAVVIRFYR